MRRGRILLCCIAAWLTVCRMGFLSAVSAEEDLDLYARSAVLMDGDSGRILYGKEAEAPMPMASTTKIMTCIIALEQAEEKQVCTASAYAVAQPQVKLGMRKGDTFYLKDLLYSLMLESHNDTAVCIAETVSGSVEGFAAAMNRKAKEIGCKDTHYVTPNGLDGEDTGGIHHTTASDLARVLRYCITQSPKKEEFLTVTQTMNYSFADLSGSGSITVNHNAFLTMMEGALTGKTGFTGKAGYCYVGALRRTDRLYIVSLLACGWPHNKSYKWSDTRKLMNYGLENFVRYPLTDPDIVTPQIMVENGQKEKAATKVQQEARELLMRDGETISTRLFMKPALKAPVNVGEQAGTLTYCLNGEPFFTCPVLTEERVEKIDYRYCLEQMLEQLLL